LLAADRAQDMQVVVAQVDTELLQDLRLPQTQQLQ
jgi:ethanolamine utilization microcompartment shell protein EutL